MKQRTEFIRVIKNKNYTIINNEFLKRKDLSWKAKGILAYILSLPDDWNINLKEVMRHATEGERAFRSGWKELDQLGYVERKPIRKGNRIDYWETIVRESVDNTATSELPRFEEVENVDVRNEDVHNDKLLSTNSTKNLNIPSTNNTKEILSSSKEPDHIPYKKIVDHLNEIADRQFRYTTNKTQRMIRARINEGFDLEDFKKVIEIKVDEWSNDPEFNKYIRPETLFGPKFESYLNQPTSHSGKERDWETWDFMG